MSNDLHWDAVAQRMRPGLAIHRTVLQNKIADGEQRLAKMTADGVAEPVLAAVREQISDWGKLLDSLDAMERA